VQQTFRPENNRPENWPSPGLSSECPLPTASTKRLPGWRPCLAETNVHEASFGSPPAARVTFTRTEAFTTRPTLQGTFGMSASTHWLATAAAQAVLERGGNAFDAAVVRRCAGSRDRNPAGRGESARCAGACRGPVAGGVLSR
jgi:hypothetical protein